MRHRDAVRHLADLLDGGLTGNLRTEAAEHLEGCESCQRWAETYRFLSGALLADDPAEHPTSDQLARFAVDAELLTEPERELLSAHLEECTECRQEIRLSRDALAGARKGATVARFPLRLPSRPTALRLALAASLILAAALSFRVVLQDDAGNGPTVASTTPAAAQPATQPVTQPVRQTAAQPAAQPASPPASQPVARPVVRPAEELPARAASDRDLSGYSLTGTQVIEARGAINAGSMAIEKDGAVTFRAGEMVVLGDGFSIASTATLGVKISPRSNEELELEDHS